MELKFNKKYIVGIYKKSESTIGSKCFDIFFETDKLLDAKQEAERAFCEENLETVVWDRTKCGNSDVYRLIKEKNDE